MKLNWIATSVWIFNLSNTFDHNVHNTSPSGRQSNYCHWIGIFQVELVLKTVPWSAVSRKYLQRNAANKEYKSLFAAFLLCNVLSFFVMSFWARKPNLRKCCTKAKLCLLTLGGQSCLCAFVGLLFWSVITSHVWHTSKSSACSPYSHKLINVA